MNLGIMEGVSPEHIGTKAVSKLNNQKPSDHREAYNHSISCKFSLSIPTYLFTLIFMKIHEIISKWLLCSQILMGYKVRVIWKSRMREICIHPSIHLMITNSRSIRRERGKFKRTSFMEDLVIHMLLSKIKCILCSGSTFK